VKLRYLSLVILFSTLSPLCGVRALAQDSPDIAMGMTPSATYHASDFDSVDMATRRLSMHIPLLVDHSQRGKLNFTYSLHFTSPSEWYIVCNSAGTICHYQASRFGIPGVTFGTDGTLTSGTQTYNNGSTVSTVHAANEADFAVHHLGSITWSGRQPIVEESIDGSGIRETFNSSGFAVLTNKDGVQFYLVGCDLNTGVCTNNIEDANGNEMTTTGPDSSHTWTTTDTVGRSWTKTTGATNVGGCPVAAVNAAVWHTPGPNGGVREFKFCYSSVTIHTNFATNICGNNPCGQYSATPNLITGVVLPDLTIWRFDYDQYGDLAKVYLPTGGTISYTWTTGSSCDGFSFPVTFVTSRTVFDGTNFSTWNYSYLWQSGGALVTATDPLNNDTVNTGNACNGAVSQIQSYAGTGSNRTLLKTVVKAYQIITDPYSYDLGGSTGQLPLPLNTTITWANGQVNQTKQTYDSGFTFTDINCCSRGSYPSVYGLVRTQSQFDYGTGSPGSVLSTTNTNYLALTNSSYLTANLLDLPSSVITMDGGNNKCAETDYGYDVPGRIVASGVTMQHVSAPSPGILGNLTSITQQLSSTPCQTGASWNSLPPSNRYVYDTGMLNQSLDPLGHPTTYGYSGTYYGAYPTTVTNALNQSTTYTYDFNTGLMASLKDYNNQTTSFQYDNMLRVTNATLPDGGQSNFYYPNTTTVEMKKQIDATRWTDSFTYYDGLGRESRSMSVNDEASPYDQVDTCYDANGRVGFKSYVYQGNGLSTTKVCSVAGDAFAYDPLSRVTQVTHSDGSTLLTSYAGRATSVQDEGSEGNGIQRVQRISQVDGLGRLASLCEVASATQLGTGGTPAACGQDIAGTGFLTTYGYDGLSNLTSVSQGGYLPRSYAYDSLSRLTTAMNPESGTANFGYDNANRLITRTGPKPTQTNPSVTVTATMAYDQINRLRSKTYANSDNSTTYLAPAVTFNYDETSALGVTGLLNTIGRESSAVVAGSQAGEVFSYDQLGRTKINSQCVPQNCSANAVFPITYTYDLLGDMTSSTNGKGVTLSYTVNRALRLTGLTSSRSDSNNPGTLYSSAHYNGAGSLLSAAMGNSGSSISETRGYDARLRLNSITDGSLYTLTIPTNGYAPDGDILLANDSVNGNWTYGYDALNRLASANATGQAYTYAYDRFGNRWQQNGPHSSSLSFSGNNNHMDTYSYDAAGNLLNDGTTSYTYDSESYMISATNSISGASSYQYDANGRRIRKTTVAKGAVDFLYDLGGNEIVELGPAGFWDRGEVYAGKRHLATYFATKTNFIISDWLGTERARSTSTGAPFETCTSLPFGDALTCVGSSDPSPMHFTGKEHDLESGLEYFGARYDSSQYGRFMTPDWSAKPASVPYAVFSNPQSLNLYAYVLNNPLRYRDADGHIIDDDDLKKNKEYQKWKTEYLSHDGAKAQWNALNDNKNITVHMGWDSKSTSSVTGGYKWDSSGNLTSVNVTLAAKTGNVSNSMSSESGYIHGSTITDPALRQAYVMAHEFAHVEYAQTPNGMGSLQQSQRDFDFTSQKFREVGMQPALQMPDVREANQRLLESGQQREVGADQRAWDLVGPQ
jgi:RHS repeat-associated protein